MADSIPRVMAGIPALHPGASTLDYYLLRSGAGSAAPPAGLLVEEFVLAGDLTAVRIRNAGWTPPPGPVDPRTFRDTGECACPGEGAGASENACHGGALPAGGFGIPRAGGWWSSAALVRALRADRSVRARVVAVDRSGAEEAYRRLGGGALPGEAVLRGYFVDDVPLPAGAPLRLGAGPGVHRLLFAGEPDPDRLDGLRALLRLGEPRAGAQAGPGVVGAGALCVGGTEFHWCLRRVGAGVAWSIDVTAGPVADASAGGTSGEPPTAGSPRGAAAGSRPGVVPGVPGGDVLRGLLFRLAGAARRQGLIPVTIDRLS